MIPSFFITEEQTELNAVRETSGITKRQDVSVGIRYATVLSNIPHYKSISYIYLHLFPVQFQGFLFVLFQLVLRVSLDTTVMSFVLSLLTVWTANQYVIVQRNPVILETGV